MMRRLWAASALALVWNAPLRAEEAKADPDARADALVSQMTLDEKIVLLHGSYPNRLKERPAGVPMSAGYVPPVDRLGIPAQRMTDASLGVAAAHQPDNPATALPSGLALASSFDPQLAYAGGRMIGAQARTKGFNVLLAGGVNLTREPRGGRNFEYLGEDPLLAGILAGESIRGIQSNQIVSTVKHYVLNAQETGRMVIDAQIGEAALRESDLFAFQKAIELGDPGAVMCSYNKINGHYGCENKVLIDILRRDWGYKGWVMSDWGAVHSTVKAAQAGLDQEMGEELDPVVWFGPMLKDAVQKGVLPETRVDQMARTILRSYFAHGVMDNPVKPGVTPDLAAGAPITRDAAGKGIVLLRNERGLLPLAASARRIVVIGGHADKGVYSGGGSSQVKPKGVVLLPPPSPAPTFIRAIYLHPDSPLAALRAALPGAEITFLDGSDLAAAAVAAKSADLAIVFASQFTMEGMDAELKLDGAQDALVDAVASAQPHNVVVLQTGGPVFMPWLNKAGAVVEAWYPGSEGGKAIADMLTGKVNPSGRLPITFPASIDQLPNPELPGSRLPRMDATGNAQPEPFAAQYPEGANVGYRWYTAKGHRPLFAFGHGLTYTAFEHSGLSFDPARLEARFTVRNTGRRAGIDTPQLYAESSDGTRKLVGWTRAALGAGKQANYRLTLDPRILASFDADKRKWVLAGGDYRLVLAASAAAPGTAITVRLAGTDYAVDWKPANGTAMAGTAR